MARLDGGPEGQLTEVVTLTEVDLRAGDTLPPPADPQEVLHLISDPTRWAILQHLATAELCTTHLQELLNTKQPVMSHHLKLLRAAGLVRTAPCGRFTYYSLRPGALDALATAIAGLAAAGHRGPLARAAC